ncbi:hypothetical protein F4808DRAFT_428379 [Astrocystis sublimbata]|nr:hypothetical protein F4808DRAFT_428379 [Astrocystis sublimbata]
MEQPQPTGWAQAWRDDVNTQQRRFAIRRFGKAIVDPAKWKASWDEGGGTSGILSLLSSASVTEVKAFCTVIRASNRRGRKSSYREKAVDELVMALLPQHYPSTTLRTRDKRPLQKFYGRMLQGCSSSFVERVLEAQDESNPLFQQLDLEKLLFAHDEMLKRRLANYLMHDGPKLCDREIDISLREFVSREPPFQGTQPNMSSSMQFGLELLQASINSAATAKRWPRHISQLDVLLSIYRRLTRKSRSADKTPLIQLGFRLIELKLDLRLSPNALVLWEGLVTLWKKSPRQYEDLVSQGVRLGLRGTASILPIVATRWKEDTDQYQQLLVECLRQGLGGSAKNISDGYMKTVDGIQRGKEPRAEKLNPELRWSLLRLYCQHVPEKGIDIETSSDFSRLANQDWSFELIEQLGKERAMLFLNRLYDVNPNFDFLRAPDNHTSIYSMCSEPRHNFNVELLLVAYRRDDADSQQRARIELDELRKKATTSREQEDRGIFAKASAHYAMAIGDLELYAETLLWQHRFIRDPLTASTIFGYDAILTQEGVSLLSGMTLSPTECATLSTARPRLAVANQILESLYEAKKTAQKEPSYRPSSWTALSSLLSDVNRQRVSRAKEIKLQSKETEIDIFNALWEGHVSLVNSIGSDFLTHALDPICDLLDDFSGPSHITASETLLNYTAEWKKKAERNSDQDQIAALMELVTWRVISQLARSKTPMLACDLIRRAIIENPEASSWHRQFLSIGYLKNLPAETAETMLLSFAAAIGEKLEEQSYVRVGDEAPAKGAPPQSMIKVSTVKYLAQLLNDAEFISPASAVEVLIELFKSARHIDIRLATLGSLLGTLNTVLADNGEQWRSNPMVEKILSTLDHVVHIAGNINERQPVKGKDWAEAKEKATVPAPSDSSDIPPLFQVILKITEGSQFPHLKKLQRELFARLVVPTLHQSQEQHRRWFALFLAKHRPALDADILPHIPITPKIWEHLLQSQAHLVPTAIMRDYNQYLLLCLQLPAEIKDLIKALQKDATLRTDPSVEHWVSIFNLSPNISSWLGGIHKLFELLLAPIEKASSDTDLMDAIVSQASALLDDYENCLVNWSSIMKDIAPARAWKNARIDSNDDGKITWEHWRKTALELTQRLITVVEKKKASSNAVMPSTFPLRLWRLPYPNPRAKRHDGDFRDLAKVLDEHLSSFLESEEGDMLFWTTLVEETHSTFASIYTDIAIRLCIARHVGDLGLDPTQKPIPAVQLIKVAITLKTIETVSGKSQLRKPKSDKDLTPEKAELGELVEQVRAVVESWDQVEQAPFRHMVMQWKRQHNNIWRDICSWASANDEDDVPYS